MNAGFLCRRLIRPTSSFPAMSTSLSETTTTIDSFPIATSIRQKLGEAFDPSHLDVINESHMHNVYVSIPHRCRCNCREKGLKTKHYLISTNLRLLVSLSYSIYLMFLYIYTSVHTLLRPKNSETHFKVVVVSSKFDSVKSPLQRHRLINATLAEELEGPVHALSIVAKSPAQWERNQNIPASPNCQGGDGSLPPKK